MRALILTVACVAGLTFSASKASADSFSFSWNSPRPVVVVRPAPSYYPHVHQPYYPPVYVQPAPLYVAPVQVAPIYVGPRPAYYPFYYGRPTYYWR